jgi:hypothetical protein
MAAVKDVAQLKRDMNKLKAYLRDQLVWERKITKAVRKLRQNSLSGPTVTDPPKPPRP